MHRFHCLVGVMYRSNRSFKIPLPPPPLPGNPSGIWLFWKLLFKFPPTRAKMPFKCPTQGSFRLSNAPTPGTFHRHINDRRMAETPSVVEENHYKYSKQFVFNITKTEKHCQHTYYKQNSCAKRQKSLLQGHWMLSFSSCVMQHTKRTIKKIPPTTIIHSTTSWPFHWHASWLTLYMWQVKVIDLCWAFYCCIESPVIVLYFIVNTTFIHSYIQNLNPALKILKLKYLQYGTKLV